MSDKASNTSSSWIARPVFISSTFKDMQAERDHLNKVVFPELAERLRARRVLLEPIDLRQGVETADVKDEQTRELLTLKVCLDEIDKSRPLLIVLLGDRYGWTPAKERLEAAANEKGFQFEVEGKSVTALEIEYGLLKKDKWLRTNSLFLFREPLPYDKMPRAEAEDYSEEYSSEANAAEKAKHLKALKQKIKADPELSKQIRPYSLGWESEKNEITGLEAWGNQVKEDIWQILDAETKDIEQRLPKTWEEEEEIAIEEFVEDRSRNFVGREDIISKLISIAHSEAKEGADWGACVTAGPGTGKSALFAKLYRELEHDESVLLLSHAAGTTPKSGDVDSMLLRWITELSVFLNISNPLPEKYSLEDLDNTFASLLSRASVKKRVVVLIDALNQFNPTTRGLHMTWLKRPWPQNARIVATAIEGDASEGLAQWAGVEEYELGGLSTNNAEDIITAIYTRYHRQVNLKVKDILLYKSGVEGEKAYTNPLWLNLALEQLNLLDEDDFTKALSSDKDPAEFIANDMPGEIPGLYEWMLKRLEKTYGTAWVVSIVALVALSRQGWREMDFAALVPEVANLLFPNQEAIEWDSLKFAVIRRGLRGQLIQSGSYGRWRFMHQQMQEAIMQHRTDSMETSLSDITLQQLIHTAICDYLLSLPCDDQIHISETMWHLIKADDKKRTAKYYGGNLVIDAIIQSTAVLAEFIINANQLFRKDAISWACALLKQDSMDYIVNREIAYRFIFYLTGLISLKIKLSDNQTIIEAAKEAISIGVDYDQENVDWQRDLAVSYQSLGDTYKDQGDLSAALDAYSKMLKTIESLVESDPGNGNWQHDLSICYQKMGHVHKAQGDMLLSQVAYMSSFKIAEILANYDAGNTVCQRDFLACHQYLGDIYRDSGNLSGAMKAYQKQLCIAEKLVRNEPNNTLFLSDLAASYDNLGKIYEKSGMLTEALNAYESGLKIGNKLVTIDPSNALMEARLSYSYFNIGNLYYMKRDFSNSERYYSAGIIIREKNAESDLENCKWQHDLWLGYNSIGDLCYIKDDTSKSLIFFKKCMSISKRLVSIDPNNTEWQDDLSLNHENLGNIYKKQGNLSDALSEYQASLKIRQKLLDGVPEGFRLLHNVAVCFEKIGGVYKAQLELSKAEDELKKSLVIREKLVKIDSNNLNSQRDLASNYNGLGNLYNAQGNYTEACQAFLKGKTIMEKLVSINPDNVAWQEDMAFLYNCLGCLYDAQDNLSAALSEYLDGMTIREKLLLIDPNNVSWIYDLCVSYINVSVVHYNQKNKACLTEFQKTISLMHALQNKGYSIPSREQEIYHQMKEILVSNGIQV